MERKKFLLTSASAIPALLIGQNVQAQKPKRPNKGFVVKATKSRFGEKTVLGGKSPNDIKVSQKDTNGDLTILNTQAMKEVDHRCTFMRIKTKYFLSFKVNIFFKLVKTNTI